MWIYFLHHMEKWFGLWMVAMIHMVAEVGKGTVVPVGCHTIVQGLIEVIVIQGCIVVCC